MILQLWFSWAFLHEYLLPLLIQCLLKAGIIDNLAHCFYIHVHESKRSVEKISPTIILNIPCLFFCFQKRILLLLNILFIFGDVEYLCKEWGQPKASPVCPKPF